MSTYKGVTYTYFLNGICISSEIEFPELQLSYQSPTVSIKLGTVPNQIPDAFYIDVDEQIAADHYLLDVDQVAKYLVVGNSEVIIEPYDKAESSVIRNCFLSTVISVLLFKHDFLTLHSCAVEVGDKAVLFLGHSGAGKSTTAFGLYTRGYAVLNEDISTIELREQGIPFVFPGVSRIKLWSKSLECFDYSTSGFQQISKNIPKFNIPINRVSKETPIPIHKLIFLSVEDVKGIECKSLDGVELFALLKANTFNEYLIHYLRKSSLHFNLIAGLMGRVTCFKITRPIGSEPKEFVDYIEALITV